MLRNGFDPALMHVKEGFVLMSFLKTALIWIGDSKQYGQRDAMRKLSHFFFNLVQYTIGSMN